VIYSTVPLRLFLALTFVYAGLQKIADPEFLDPTAPTYIGAQLQSFTTTSPIGFLIEWLALPVPQLTPTPLSPINLQVGSDGGIYAG
jgi:thiosulfate dehydrogenase [quinone] large subunit